jgi:hypothetical protein
MLNNVKSILNVFLPATKQEYDANQLDKWAEQHDQVRDFSGYRTWIPLGNMEPSLDVPAIFRSHGHFTDWELGFNGYASNYISVPKDPGSLRGSR